MKTRLVKTKAVRHAPISQYTWPTDGVAYTMPFGIHNLEEVTASGLIAMAERYETSAAFFRKLAAKISNETK